jgi:hypothetical protein
MEATVEGRKIETVSGACFLDNCESCTSPNCAHECHLGGLKATARHMGDYT